MVPFDVIIDPPVDPTTNWLAITVIGLVVIALVVLLAILGKKRLMMKTDAGGAS